MPRLVAGPAAVILSHPADAAIILSTETVFAALFGAWLMGDRLGIAGLAGAALILACVLAMQVLPMLTLRRSP